MVRVIEQVGGKKGTARNTYTREKTYHILGTRDADTAYLCSIIGWLKDRLN